MPDTAFGQTGLRPSALAFGCNHIALNRGPDRRREAEAALTEAHEAGINFFDIADVYARAYVGAGTRWPLALGQQLSNAASASCHQPNSPKPLVAVAMSPNNPMPAMPACWPKLCCCGR